MSAEVEKLSLFTELEERGFYTPDFGVLREYPRLPLFVYDETKKRGTNSFYLRGAEFLGRAFTMTPHYQMKDNSYTPVVFERTNEDVQRAHIRGEMYLTSVEHICFLDRFYDNGIRLERVLKRFYLEDQTPLHGNYHLNLPWMQAFMYIGNEDYHKDKVLYARGMIRELHNQNKIGQRQHFDWTGYWRPSNNENNRNKGGYSLLNDGWPDDIDVYNSERNFH